MKDLKKHPATKGVSNTAVDKRNKPTNAAKTPMGKLGGKKC